CELPWSTNDGNVVEIMSRILKDCPRTNKVDKLQREVASKTLSGSMGIFGERQILRVQLRDTKQGLQAVYPFQCTFAIASCHRAIAPR
ncbi:hypothetical protein HAX54_048910, partial [Datura stramonium]|nr:hypothetical protein [Datura stramonium]